MKRKSFQEWMNHKTVVLAVVYENKLNEGVCTQTAAVLEPGTDPADIANIDAEELRKRIYAVKIECPNRVAIASWGNTNGQPIAYKWAGEEGGQTGKYVPMYNCPTCGKNVQVKRLTKDPRTGQKLVKGISKSCQHEFEAKKPAYYKWVGDNRQGIWRWHWAPDVAVSRKQSSHPHHPIDWAGAFGKISTVPGNRPGDPVPPAYAKEMEADLQALTDGNELDKLTNKAVDLRKTKTPIFDTFWMLYKNGMEDQRAHPSMWNRLENAAKHQAPYEGPIERDIDTGTPIPQEDAWGRSLYICPVCGRKNVKVVDNAKTANGDAFIYATKNSPLAMEYLKLQFASANRRQITTKELNNIKKNPPVMAQKANCGHEFFLGNQMATQAPEIQRLWKAIPGRFTGILQYAKEPERIFNLVAEPVTSPDDAKMRTEPDQSRATRLAYGSGTLIPKGKMTPADLQGMTNQSWGGRIHNTDADQVQTALTADFLDRMS